ncbi:MAG TPA: hypothetical protein VJM12_10075 [Pyrinomonadaceae bacterium]|nr:hypothetical protein [Pyrinomonadaceae bacterium]
MERVDFSALISNLLVFSAVVVVSTALLMGDQLVLLASNVFDEGASVVRDISTSVQSWLG